jgi:hypothetical protein
MIYVAWASLYEGSSDVGYFDILIPRLMEDLLARRGRQSAVVPATPSIRLGSTNRSVAAVAAEMCKSREAFHVIFIHADTGGRSQEEKIDSRTVEYCEEAHRQCQWRTDRCIYLKPRHEMEAWALSDPAAVLKAFGYIGPANDLGLPADGKAAERLADPKIVLRNAAEKVRGRRRPGRTAVPFAAIAQNQSLNALRNCDSFGEFEANLESAFVTLGWVSLT